MGNSQMIWLSLSTFLVLIMQAGFACFEAGLVRSKNSINVAIKNVADLGTSVIVFMALGYGLMFGDSVGALFGLIGWGPSPLLSDEPQRMLTGLFQAMFAGTAVTIVSGAVAERMSFRGYLILAVTVPVLIYPVTGHWVWGSDGWLAVLGFRDVAGGTVVHVVGGAVALAATLVLGPRLGRFEQPGGIEPSNLAVSALGAFLLMFGWFGFNSGASLSIEREVPLILVNTAVGGSAGIVTGLLFRLLQREKPTAQDLFSGMLGGLVGITAGCALITPPGALCLGLLGALAALFSTPLLEKLRIDDPVAAIPVHLCAGLLGTAFLPVFASESAIPVQHGSRFSWFLIQGLGALAVAVFAFGAAYLFLRLSRPIAGYRVSAEDERVGLNVAEHNARSGLLELLDQMAGQGRSGDFSEALRAEPETDAAYIARFYNDVRERFVAEVSQSQKLLEESRYLAAHDALTGLHNRRAFQEHANARLAEIRRYGGQTALILLDLDHFKQINDCHGHDAGDAVLVEVARRLRREARASDLVARIGGEEIMVLLTQASLEEALEAASRFRLALSDEDFTTASGPITVTASFGVAAMSAEHGVEAALKVCDRALYEAKAGGRNRVCRAACAPQSPGAIPA